MQRVRGRKLQIWRSMHITRHVLLKFVTRPSYIALSSNATGEERKLQIWRSPHHAPRVLLRFVAFPPYIAL